MMKAGKKDNDVQVRVDQSAQEMFRSISTLLVCVIKATFFSRIFLKIVELFSWLISLPLTIILSQLYEVFLKPLAQKIWLQLKIEKYITTVKQKSSFLDLFSFDVTSVLSVGTYISLTLRILRDVYI